MAKVLQGQVFVPASELVFSWQLTFNKTLILNPLWCGKTFQTSAFQIKALPVIDFSFAPLIERLTNTGKLS